MKINTKFWVIISITSLIIIVINYKGFTKEKKYLFERVYTNNSELLNFNDNCFDSITDYNNIIYSNYLITEYKNLKNGKFQLNNFKIESNKKISTIELSLPNIPSFVKNDSVYFVEKFILYKKSSHSDNSTKITPPKLKVFQAFPLINDIILQGELESDGVFITGFFKLENNEITLIHTLKVNDISSAIENSLIYSGLFRQSDSYIIFTSLQNSNIFIFNSKGVLTKNIKTKDNVPLPQISKSNEFYTYKRGFTFNTNNGAFLNGNLLYVISVRNSDNDILIFDKYDLNTGKYLNSIKINNLFIKNEDVYSISRVGNKLVILSKYRFVCFDLNLTT